MVADTVADPTTTYREQIHEEVDALPDEQLLMVLKIVQAVRENMALKSAEESFKQGWREAQAGVVRESEVLHSPAEGLKQGLRDAKAGRLVPLAQLWEGIDAE